MMRYLNREGDSMISEEQINILCFQGESNCVDYKRAQYAFQGASDT